MRWALLLILCLPLAAEDQPRFQRQAWLSEKQNNAAERWFDEDKKLYALLFQIPHPEERKELTKEQVERITRWLTQDNELFTLLYGIAWPPKRTPEELGLIRL